MLSSGVQGRARVLMCGSSCRPLASLNADYPTHQRHGGRQFGYITGPDTRELQQMTWRKETGRWGCATGPEEFPSMRPGMLCSSTHLKRAETLGGFLRAEPGGIVFLLHS